MTPLGKSVTWELRSAMATIETSTIIDVCFLPRTCEALVTNALFYVRATPAIEAARADVFATTAELADAITSLGVHPEGTSPAIDAARARAVAAFKALIDSVQDAQVTPAGCVLGVALPTHPRSWPS